MNLSSSASDRRDGVRLPLVFTARYRIGSPEETFQKATAFDISAGGVRIEWDEAVGPGTRVLLSLAPEPMRNLRLTGEVMWSRPSAGRVGYHEVGLRFEGGCGADRNWLRKFTSNPS